MKKVVVYALCLFAVLQIAAQEADLKSDLKSASEITLSGDRLEAYDKILEKYGIRIADKEKVESNWIVTVKTNPIDDSKVIIFILPATIGEGVYGDKIGLIIRYNNGEIDLYINWNSYLGSEAVVTMRVGTKEASKYEWNISTDSKATFYPGDVKELVKEIMEVDKLVFQCTPYSENPITVIFDVVGLKSEVLKYNEDLKWL